MKKNRLYARVHLQYCIFGKIGGGGGGGCNPKKSEKNRKKPVPNLKFAVAFGFFFRYFVVLFRFFFGLTFDKKFQPFKNHVNNEILGGQELSNNTLNA